MVWCTPTVRKLQKEIDHYVLINKLLRIKFSQSLTKLIESYLVDSKQYVEYLITKWISSVPSFAVPQVSILWPLLFLIFINNILDTLNRHVLLFADDVKILQNIKSADDCQYLQQDFLNVTKWCLRNSVQLNINKCKAMFYTRKHLFIQYNYTIKRIVRCEIVRNLWVNFNTNL